jgi:hypothetical protein
MDKFSKAAFYRDRYLDKVMIAFEYAITRRWARAHQFILQDKNRPTVGERVPPLKQADHL